MSGVCSESLVDKTHVQIGRKVLMNLEHFLKIHAIHMTLDGICFTAEGFLKPLPGSVPDKIQRLYLAQHDNGFLRCFREDLPTHICQQLNQLHPEQILNDPETIKTLLAGDTPCEGFPGCRSTGCNVPISVYAVLARRNHEYVAGIRRHSKRAHCFHLPII